MPSFNVSTYANYFGKINKVKISNLKIVGKLKVNSEEEVKAKVKHILDM
jgi:hypothetical protein